MKKRTIERVTMRVKRRERRSGRTSTVGELEFI
jgi:hypothetical protein